MDTITALVGDIELARTISKSSSFVAESKKNPLFQKFMTGLNEISTRNNHLTDDEVDSLRRRRDTLYSKQNINTIERMEDFDHASEETVQMAAILSNRKEDLLKGALGISTRFAKPIINIIEDTAYSGTTGMRKKDDGSLDHTAKRVYATSTDTQLNTLLTLTMDDRKRAMQAAEVVNDVENEIDPFDGWIKNEILKEKAKKARERASNVSVQTNTTSPDSGSSSSGLDWRSLI